VTTSIKEVRPLMSNALMKKFIFGPFTVSRNNAFNLMSNLCSQSASVFRVGVRHPIID